MQLFKYHNAEVNEEFLLGMVGKGWSVILSSLLADLLVLGWDRQVMQIKEKFGGLRFYIGEGSDEVYDRIARAEKESYSTCEDCGFSPCKAAVYTGWIRVLCPECGEKYQASRESEIQKYNEKYGKSE